MLEQNPPSLETIVRILSHNHDFDTLLEKMIEYLLLDKNICCEMKYGSAGIVMPMYFAGHDKKENI